MEKKSQPHQTAVNETSPESISGRADDESCDDRSGHDQWLRDNVPPHHR